MLIEHVQSVKTSRGVTNWSDKTW